MNQYRGWEIRQWIGGFKVKPIFKTEKSEEYYRGISTSNNIFTSKLSAIMWINSKVGKRILKDCISRDEMYSLYDGADDGEDDFNW